MHAASQSVPACRLLCIVPTRWSRLAGLGSGATFYNGNSRPYSGLRNATEFLLPGFGDEKLSTRLAAAVLGKESPSQNWSPSAGGVWSVCACAAASTKVCRKANCSGRALLWVERVTSPRLFRIRCLIASHSTHGRPINTNIRRN